jgi:glycosyltransferase involved in cell wall biosynthesis
LVHPLDTLLDAIGESSETRPVKYVFIGGGRGKEAVERSAAKFPDQRIVSLPYQALEKIKYSLSAADVHIVSFGNAMVGIVHPCKLYSAMALGKPILFLGPKHSALGQIIERHEIGWCVDHRDQNEMKRLLRELPLLGKDVLLRMGAKASMVAERHYSREKLCGEFCEVLEDALGG